MFGESLRFLISIGNFSSSQFAINQIIFDDAFIVLCYEAGETFNFDYESFRIKRDLE